MLEVPSIAWVLAVLTIVLMYIVLSTRRRKKMRWGRTTTGYPMSSVGAYTCLGVLLLLDTAAFGYLPFGVIFLSVPLLVCAGVYDAYRDYRKTKHRDGQSTENPSMRKRGE